MFSSRKILQFDVTKIPGLGVNSGFGKFILKGLQVFCTSRAVLSFRKHADNAIAVGRGEASGLATELLTASFNICLNAGEMRRMRTANTVFNGLLNIYGVT